jgi:hypothetical protein
MHVSLTQVCSRVEVTKENNTWQHDGVVGKSQGRFQVFDVSAFLALALRLTMVQVFIKTASLHRMGYMPAFSSHLLPRLLIHPSILTIDQRPQCGEPREPEQGSSSRPAFHSTIFLC